MGFQETAESEITAALGAQLATAAEAAAQHEADWREQDALREALEEARAQVYALGAHTRARLEAARAERTQVLEESRAQMSAVREEAERAATAHRQLVDDLRAQLEQARADLQQTRADAERVEKVAPAQSEAMRAELEAPKQPEDPAQVTSTEVPGAAQDDRFAPMFSAPDGAATLTETGEDDGAGPNRRQHIRVAGPFDGYRIDLLETPVRIYDLAAGGCFINSLYETTTKNKRLGLKIFLPSEGWITVEAETLYNRPGFGFAVRFVELPEHTRARLYRALRKLQTRRDRLGQ